MLLQLVPQVPQMAALLKITGNTEESYEFVKQSKGIPLQSLDFEMRRQGA